MKLTIVCVQLSLKNFYPEEAEASQEFPPGLYFHNFHSYLASAAFFHSFKLYCKMSDANMTRNLGLYNSCFYCGASYWCLFYEKHIKTDILFFVDAPIEVHFEIIKKHISIYLLVFVKKNCAFPDLFLNKISLFSFHMKFKVSLEWLPFEIVFRRSVIGYKFGPLIWWICLPLLIFDILVSPYLQWSIDFYHILSRVFTSRYIASVILIRLLPSASSFLFLCVNTVFP